MASTWSALKIELLETGQNSGTWGTLTNVNLGDAVLGEAITGSATVDFPTDADVTVTLTDSATSQSARNLRLNITESSTGVGSVRSLILGSGCQIEKFYLINNTGTGAKTVKNTTGTGISVPAGKATLVYNNGTNVVDAATYFTSLTLGTALPVASGGTGLSSGTSGGVLAYTATGTLASSAALTQYGVVYGGGAGAVPVATAAGTTGQVLTATTSGAPSWAAPATSGTVTSVAMTVPSVLSISGSPITSSGTLALTYSGTALPVLNGGTGVTTSTGTTNVVLSNSPTLVAPNLGSPSSVGTMPAFTLGGTVSGGGNQINNVVIGTTTPLAGAFTTLSATQTTNLATADTYKVAIGTIAAAQKLHVLDTIGGTTGTIQLGSLAYYATIQHEAGVTGSLIFSTAAASGGGWRFRDGSTDRVLISQSGTLSGGTSGTAYSFSGSAPATSLTLDSSGNLGIGTNSIPAGFKLYASGGSMLLDNNTAFRQKDSAGNNTLIFALSSSNNMEFGSGVHTGGMAFVTGNSNITFTTNSAERARIDSAGNLGLGVTPSAWGTGNNVRALQMNAGSLWSYTTDALTMAQNSYYNGTNYIYSITSTATQYVQVAGQHQWFNAASGTAGNVITFTQAMTLGASGNLGIGTTSPAARLTVAKSFNISNDGVYAPASASGTGLNFGFDGAGTEQSWIQALRNNTSETRNLLLNTLGGNVLVGAISNTSGGGCLQISNGITFPATQSASSDANTLDDYEEYTATSAACTGAITTAAVWKLTKVGNQVTLTLPAVTGTASSSFYYFYFGTVLPAKFRPTATIQVTCAVIIDNNVRQTATGVVGLATSGEISITRDNGLTVFSSAANTGLYFSTSVSWTI